ncbi:trigger factor-like protein TIG, Chloroplastic [Euphorbia lathyris]|uniref:trigger factor-like protein TIG, Chloroplastic n=1 Tax=Euphorbia lathyris TaxID=212925 RepID=UPI003313B461
MVEVDIPRSFFEEQGRQLYGSQLLQIQANMKLSEQQLASLSSPKAVNEFLEHQNENIAKVIKQKLAVGDIFKPENLQFSTEELVKEVENSIAEFKRHKQEYDEDNVKEHQTTVDCCGLWLASLELVVVFKLIWSMPRIGSAISTSNQPSRLSEDQSQ